MNLAFWGGGGWDFERDIFPFASARTTTATWTHTLRKLADFHLKALLHLVDSRNGRSK